MYGITDEITFKKQNFREDGKASFLYRAAGNGHSGDASSTRLIGLEIEALQKEHEETIRKIERYEKILNDYDEMSAVIIDDLNKLKKRICGEAPHPSLKMQRKQFTRRKKIEEQEVICLVDRFGYARTVDPSVYERNQEAADAESRYINPLHEYRKALSVYLLKDGCTRSRYWISRMANSGTRDFRWTISVILTARKNISLR